MRSRYPCPDRCSCHSAGPSTRPAATTAHHTATIAGPSTWNRTAPALFLAASLAAPALAAPAPAPAPRPDLAFLYPALERRVTDAGQAPDDSSTGWFAPQNVEVDDLVAAGLSIKFRYDPSARAAAAKQDDAGAWVLDDYWELHGKRFGPHTTTVDISDDPLPTTTQSATSTIPSATATATRSTIPSLLAIESSLPTGWSDPDYRNSGIYRIPIVISFAVVIALMIGFLIGALVYRRAQRRKRRRKKEQRARAADQHDDDAATQPSLREKTASKSLSARVGRALWASKHNSELRRRLTRQSTNDDMSPTDAEHGQQEAEDMREVAERTALEERVKSWARRSAVWRVQARMGMRRKMGKGQRRGLDVPADINEHGNDDPVRSHTSSRPPSPVQSRTSRDEPRPPTVVITNVDPDQAAAVNVTPTVPTYSSMSGSGTGSSQPGSSTDTSPTPSTSHDAHPDATPSDEPAYEYGSGLPPAYRRGEGMTEVRRGKMPMREETDVEEPREGIRREEAREVQARNWTALDAYAFASEEGGQEGCITAHVATDDKQVLERLREMRGAPEAEPEDGLGAGAVPREEDVFGAPGVEAEPLGGSSQPQVFPPPPDSQTRVLPREDESVIPAPPEKTGSGPVARYVEADMSLPGYLEGRACSAEGTMGPSAPSEELGPLAPPRELGPSAPPEEFRLSATSADFSPSAPPEDLTPSAPEFGPSSPPEIVPTAPLAPSAPPLEGDEPTPESDLPKPSAPPAEHESSMPRLRHLNSSSPLLEHVEEHQ